MPDDRISGTSPNSAVVNTQGVSITAFAPISHPIELTGVMPNVSSQVSGTLVIDTDGLTYMAFDATIISYVGGTNPSTTFVLDRQGSDGLWYNITSSPALNAGQTYTLDIGPGFGTSGTLKATEHAVFTSTARITWTTSGSATAVFFGLSAVGR